MKNVLIFCYFEVTAADKWLKYLISKFALNILWQVALIFVYARSYLLSAYSAHSRILVHSRLLSLATAHRIVSAPRLLNVREY